MGKKDKIPPPGKDPNTKFYTKAKWKGFLSKAFLDVPGRSLQAPGAKIVGNALAKNKFVCKIDFSHNHFGDLGAIELAQILKVNDTIQDLNISCNDITDVGGIAIACAFVPCANPTGQPAQWNRTLYYLNMSGNLLGNDSLIALANAAACNRDLAKIDLSRNKIGGFGCKAIMRSMQRNNLCNFCLNWNQLGDEGVQHVCAAWERFAGKGAQAVMNLSNNNFAKGGAEAIGNLLRNNDYVKEVNVGWNTFGMKGAEALVHGMVGEGQKNVVQYLNLQYCYLQDDGAKEIAKLIEANLPDLTKLNISGNEISDAGGVAIANALAKNTTLRNINMSHNPFKEQTADALGEALLQNKAIKAVGIMGNAMPKDAKLRLNDAYGTAKKDNDGLRVDIGRDMEGGETGPLDAVKDKLSGFLDTLRQQEEEKAKSKKGKKK